MRIHTSLSRSEVYNAVRAAGDDVYALKFEQHGSRSHSRAFEVILAGTSPRRNMSNTDYAATWDEVGKMLAHIFREDPQATVKGMMPYRNAEHFHWTTGGRFLSPVPPETHKCHKWEPLGRVDGAYEFQCACGALFRREA